MSKRERDELADAAEHEYTKDIDYIRARMVEIERGVALNQVSVDVMDRFKSALYCYVNGQFLATIAVAATTAEQISAELLQRIQTPSGSLRAASLGRGLSQDIKLKLLRMHGTIDQPTYQELNKIRGARNEHIHPPDRKRARAEQADALLCMKSLIVAMTHIYSRARGHMG